MAENVTIVGLMQAASMLQTIGWLGETFTITKQTATAYNPATTQGTADSSTQTVKGVFDNHRSYRPDQTGADVRGFEQAIIIGTKATDDSDLSFIPGVGDLVTSDSISHSIRAVEKLQGSQGVTVFYRLIFESA